MTNMNKVPDAPSYQATLEEMSDLSALLAKASHLAFRYGAVRIDPPKDWLRPTLRMDSNTMFYVREQTIPAAPFIDPSVFSANEQSPIPKRTRVKRTVNDDDDSCNADDKTSNLNERTCCVENEKILKCPQTSQLASVQPPSAAFPTTSTCVDNSTLNITNSGQKALDNAATTTNHLKDILNLSESEKHELHVQSMTGNDVRVSKKAKVELPKSVSPQGQPIVPVSNAGDRAKFHATAPISSISSSIQPPAFEIPTSAVVHTDTSFTRANFGQEQVLPLVYQRTSSNISGVPVNQDVGFVFNQTGPFLNPDASSNNPVPHSQIVSLPSVSGSASNNHLTQHGASVPLGAGTVSGHDTQPISTSSASQLQKIPHLGEQNGNINNVPADIPTQRGTKPHLSLSPHNASQAATNMGFAQSNFHFDKNCNMITSSRTISHVFNCPAETQSSPAEQLASSIIDDVLSSVVSGGGCRSTSNLTLLNPSRNTCSLDDIRGDLETRNSERVPRAWPLQVETLLPERALSNSAATSKAPFPDVNQKDFQQHTTPKGRCFSHVEQEDLNVCHVPPSSTPSQPPLQAAPHPNISSCSDRDTLHTSPCSTGKSPMSLETFKAGRSGIFSQELHHTTMRYDDMNPTNLHRATANEKPDVVMNPLHVNENEDLGGYALQKKELMNGNEPLEPSKNTEALKPYAGNNRNLCIDSNIEDGSSQCQLRDKNMLIDQNTTLPPSYATNMGGGMQRNMKDVNDQSKKACLESASKQNTFSSATEVVAFDGRNNFKQKKDEDKPVEIKNLLIDLENEPVMNDEDEDVKEIHVIRARSRRITRANSDNPKKPAPNASSKVNPEKRSRKRKFKTLQSAYNQDERGRLTKPIIFPDNPKMFSLTTYHKEACARSENISKELPGKFKIQADKNETDEQLKQRIDDLEDSFWNAMKFGVNGHSIRVSYGVDVEAEGAFNTEERAYLRWSGVEASCNPGVDKKRRGPFSQKPEGCDAVKSEYNLNSSKPNAATEIQDGAEDEILEEGRAYDAGREFKPQIPNHSQPGPFPGMIQSEPRSHVSNLNRNGLLRHLPMMPGINHTMFYIGQLFTRFCWHVEDAFLNSVSYLHSGSSEKIWYAVPPMFATAFEKYSSENVFSPELLEYGENSGQVLLMNKTTIFDPRTIMGHGIEVYRVVHKEGSFVLTAPRAYHAGFNCGFNVAEAVNFAQPSWLSVGREAAKVGREIGRPLCVPWEYLLYHEAKSLLRKYYQSLPTNPFEREQALLNVQLVVTEMRALITEGEERIMRYAEKTNCRVSMLKDVDTLAENKELGPEFGHGAGMLCSLCSQASHFYSEICGNCKTNYNTRCVYHLGEKPKLCTIPGHRTVLVRRHDPLMLLDVVEQLEDIGGVTVPIEERYRRLKQFVRSWDTPIPKNSGLRLKMNLATAPSGPPPIIETEDRKEKKRKRYEYDDDDDDSGNDDDDITDDDCERIREGNDGRKTSSKHTVKKSRKGFKASDDANRHIVFLNDIIR